MTLTERIERGEIGISAIGEDGIVTASEKLRQEVLEIVRAGEREQWIPVSERLPEINENSPFGVGALGVHPVNGQVQFMRYRANKYARTEKGRAPRWEDYFGRLCESPTYWRPLPEPPGGLK